MPNVIQFDRSTNPPLFPFTFGASSSTVPDAAAPAAAPKTFLQFRSHNNDKDYWEMDMLTDFFTEHLRMKANRADTAVSVWKAFHTDPVFQKKLVEATLDRNEGFTPRSAREAVYVCLVSFCLSLYFFFFFPFFVFLFLFFFFLCFGFFLVCFAFGGGRQTNAMQYRKPKCKAKPKPVIDRVNWQSSAIRLCLCIGSCCVAIGIANATTNNNTPTFHRHRVHTTTTTTTSCSCKCIGIGIGIGICIDHQVSYM